MRFREFKRFIGKTTEETAHWLTTELNSVMRELYIGLRKLNFKENFQCFEWEGEILPGEEVAIYHSLGRTPTSFITTRPVGTGLIIIGDTEPSPTVFYVKNIASSTTFNGKILVLL
jgi:hypothetical protein